MDGKAFFEIFFFLLSFPSSIENNGFRAVLTLLYNFSRGSAIKAKKNVNDSKREVSGGRTNFKLAIKIISKVLAIIMYVYSHTHTYSYMRHSFVIIYFCIQKDQMVR